MRNKKVKIIATVGPSINSKIKLIQMAQSGTDVFRLNMSHLSTDEALKLVKLIQAVELQVRRPLGILVDLSGPKIRVGKVKEGSILIGNQKVKIVVNQILGSNEKFFINHPSLLKQFKKGTTIFLGDGEIILEVLKNDKNLATARVISGGTLRSNMGFLARDIALRNTRTVKDTKDIKELAKSGITAFALSFVQSKKEILSVKKMLPQNYSPLIIAKIETTTALKNIDEILDAADGIMVARGDLGLAVPMEEIPFIQKELIKLALERAKPVITATQMLNSMQYNVLPTRAEITDVTNAILDGTDAILFSNETATGNFPIDVINMARAIIHSTENKVKVHEFQEDTYIDSAVSASVVHIAEQVGAKLIIVLTASGRTAQRISRHRFNLPILALTLNEQTIRKLNFSWGVYPGVKADAKIHNLKQLIKKTQSAAKNNTVIKLNKEDVFIISAGIPFDMSGNTNLVLVQRVK